MAYKCNTCGKLNKIVNQCRCDKNNLPTTFDYENHINMLEETINRFLRIIKEKEATIETLKQTQGISKISI